MTDTLIAAAEALAETLAEENAALATLDLGAAAALLERKRAAAEALARAQAEPPAPPDAAERALATRLRALAEENRRLLERGLRVQARVLALVARAVPPPAAPRYGRQGAPAPGAAAPVIVSARV